MKILVLDLETTVQKLNDKKDNSPFNPDNFCVSAHFGWLGWDSVDGVQHLVFNHNDKQGSDPIGPLEAALEQADLLVAQNAKFDCLWLQEMGLTIPDKVYCTMIGEYILAKGQRQELSLKATAERRNVTRKKSDLVDEMFKKGIGFEAMPLDIVLEYAEADVISCGEIYLAQQDDFSKDQNKSLTNIVELMNEMLIFLLEIESNGIHIDMQALDEVEQLFSAEKAELERDLLRIVEEVMGDTPINLNSGADMTAVVYSRRVRNRNLHQEVFNIGLAASGKPLPRPRMNQQEFNTAVRTTTDVVYRTVAVCCHECNGNGKVYRVKKDGNFYARPNICKTCNGAGAIYENTGKVAGLKLKPVNVQYATINGFAADKDTIKLLILQAQEKGNLQAEEFLTKLSRLNAVSTYLDSFVQGIRTWTRHDNILHTNMNQTIAATGRLSSSNPNFQNQPKRGFPIRKAVTSRFEGGCIIEADFSGLEFRVAGEVSRDPQIIEDIMNGKDVHKQTASIINRCRPEEVSKDMRQNAKAFTFAPLYGGMGATEPPHIQEYFKQFFVIYKGLAEYQKRLMDGVLRNGIVQTPSGRQYYWPNVRRLKNGRTTNATQIVNYPIQGFATGDLVPLACIRALAAFKRLKLSSKLILTVHDSIVVDCFPGEEDQVCAVLKDAMIGVSDEAERRWGYSFALPLGIEISKGENWLDQNELSVD
jgi:DNA polymerase I-like protein with 3'-5' exonuclease and polymerase domains